jgi:hypothetical protein
MILRCARISPGFAPLALVSSYAVGRIFLLSPANCGGRRATQILSEKADFPLARRLRSVEGAPLGDIFAFMSGLYFRGKLIYARRFADPPDPDDPLASGGVLVITPNAGLRGADVAVTRESIRAFAGEPIDLDNPRYLRPLERSATTVRAAVGGECEVVLLGSVASGKYIEVLQPVFGDRLVFPSAFVGRGDMSRGGLMLRCADSGDELDYVPLAGAVRHGPRPPKLTPLPAAR